MTILLNYCEFPLYSILPVFTPPKGIKNIVGFLRYLLKRSKVFLVLVPQVQKTVFNILRFYRTYYPLLITFIFGG